MSVEKKAALLLSSLLCMKRIPRSGWIGALAPYESLASHSFGTALFAIALARMEGLPEKDEYALVRLALLHDIAEIYTGDLTPMQKKYVSADFSRAEKDLLEGTPFEQDISLFKSKRLAVLACDADKLDLLFQAREYEKAGNKNMRRFIRSALRQIKSKSGKKLAALALRSTGP